MALERPVIRFEEYRGHVLEARHLGPDLLAYTDGVELANFYLDAEAAINAGRKYVDNKLEEEHKQTAAKESQRQADQRKARKRGVK